MPKVLSYTPEWLSRPNPGHELFTPKQANGSSIAAKREEPGPRKTIATRGSEIFVAVGHEIRWADLVSLKEGLQPAYRTLKVSVPLPITRLTLSPGEDYLAVSTSHTVHVVHLPDSSLLQDDDSSPIKPKAFQVGPTAHVTEESPVATVLWHPLGYHGRCLVTITKAGVVRLWEINRADRGSFSEPALSVDLAKLANATNDQDDLSASKFGASKGFSPDSVDLEVASACFGDFPEQEGVHGWAPMTLWIATVPGDVYALCPLLPSKWQLNESTGAFTFLQTLTSSINTNYTELSEDNNASKYEVKTSEKQVAWLSDLIYEEPFLEELPTGDSIKVFARPESAPVVPLLQGPFSISPEVDDFELSDMIVYSLKTLSDGTEEEAAEGIPTAVICLLTDTCKVHVCLDLQGIVGRWLPSPEDDIDDFESDHELIIAETIALVNDDEPSYNQSITPDVHSDFTFFVSHTSGVFYISIESWIRELETELSSSQTEGAEFRIQRVLESAKSTVEKHLNRKATGKTAAQKVTSSVVIEDGNIGYLLLTTIDNEPFAAILDAPEDGLHSNEDIAAHRDVEGPVNEVREAWQPPTELFEPIDLLKSINIPAHHRAAMKEEIKLSPSNLELLMNVHRVLSARTHRLQHAVLDLFNRVTRMQDDFRDQVWRTAQVTSKIDAVVGNDDTQSQASGSLYGTAHIEERLDRVRSRQDQLNQRYEKLRNKVSKLSSADLSDKEASFVAELAAMDAAVDSSNTSLSIDEDGTQIPAWKRLEEIKALQGKLVKQVEDATKDAATEGRSRAASVNVPSQSRKVENEMIQEMLERNRVLVEAATQRLRGLGVAIPVEGR